MKKFIILIISILIPLNVFAYSNFIMPGGDTLGIEVQNDGIIIIGFYKVNGKYNNNNLKVGDIILKINEKEVQSVNSLVKEIEENIVDGKVTITIKRNDKIINKEITLEMVDGVYKTGLYVKDSVIGLGVLTYVDPKTRTFGCLGHQISNWRS